MLSSVTLRFVGFYDVAFSTLGKAYDGFAILADETIQMDPLVP
jgi:hypothetical protein